MSETIRTNPLRVGNFTSSEIYNLMAIAKDGKGLGATALTYVEEKNFERKLGRPLEQEVNATPLLWGQLVENIIFELLGTEYKRTSVDTVQHPTIPYWAGSADLIKFDEGKTAVDLKCPQTLKSFCQLVQPIMDGLTGMEAMRAIADGYTDDKGGKHKAHKDGEKFLYQIISNAIINGCKWGELIVYVPYLKELNDIRMLAQEESKKSQEAGGDPYKFYRIGSANDDQLPYLVEGKYYKNINIIRFPILQTDIDALTSRVIEAGKSLITILKI